MNYQQNAIAGEAWTRAVRVVIENPLDQTPTVNFVEERIINLPDQQLRTLTGNVVEPFLDSAESFEIPDPETGAVMGSATYQDVYVVLHALYRHCAAKRDARKA